MEETYEEIIDSIRSLATRTVEDRFAIAKLVKDLLRKGYELEKIAEEVGISAKTLQEYVDVLNFWGDDRIHNCTVWWAYKIVLGWTPQFLKEFDVVARAQTLGHRVMEDCIITWNRRQNTLRRIKTQQQLTKSAPSRFVNRLWDLTVSYEDLDPSAMTDEEVEKIARGFKAIIDVGQKFRKEVQARKQKAS